MSPASGLAQLVYWLGDAQVRLRRVLSEFSLRVPQGCIRLCAVHCRLRAGRASAAATIADRSAWTDAHLRHPRRRQDTRVRLDQILAVASAGNYVEFILDDGRKLLMRSPLSALKNELWTHGFVRTHRSWLVNPGRMTALKPEGSGDYRVELGSISRRSRADSRRRWRNGATANTASLNSHAARERPLFAHSFR